MDYQEDSGVHGVYLYREDARIGLHDVMAMAFQSGVAAATSEHGLTDFSMAGTSVAPVPNAAMFDRVTKWVEGHQWDTQVFRTDWGGQTDVCMVIWPLAFSQAVELMKFVRA